MSLRLGTGIGPLGGAGMVGSWNASSLIASVQRGTFSFGTSDTTINTTINPVDASRAIAIFTGTTNGGVDAQGLLPRIQLTSNTNVQAVRGYQDGSNGATAPWQVIEFIPGVIKSIQISNIYYISGSTTATITAVNTSKSVVMSTGYSRASAGSGTPSYAYQPYFILTNSTTVTGGIGAAADITQLFTVLEFY